VVTVRDAVEKQRLHQELRAKLADLAIIADVVVGAALRAAGKGGLSMEERLQPQLLRLYTALDDTGSELERSAALAALQGTAVAFLRTDLPDEASAPWERQCLHWPLAFPEVFLGSGRRRFDVIVGNPPFLGGTKISEALGQAYRQHLSQSVAGRPTNRADLVAFFLLRAADVGRRFGLLATNTVSQGDTREVGLSVLIDERNWVVTSASKSSPWPGDATLEIAKLWMQADTWGTTVTLDGQRVARINSLLESARRSTGQPKRLVANIGKCFLGDQLNSLGFVISAQEADDLIRIEPDAGDIVRPYLSGEDLNTSATQAASRMVINFHDWPLQRAERYPAALNMVEQRAKPDIERKGVKNYKGWSDRWWQFWMYKSALHRTTDELSRVIAMAKVSKTVAPVLVQSKVVFTDKVVVFAFDDDSSFASIASAFHYWWTITYASTMRTDVSYNPTDCFETFPMPPPTAAAYAAGAALDQHRRGMMEARTSGLTMIYNRVHDAGERDTGIARLRELHVALDFAVSEAYGWTDLGLDHHHWKTRQGVRFTVSPAARDELLDRLLELNHQRYAHEVAAGLHDKRTKNDTGKRARLVDVNQESLH
jgi:hypothetical protein